MYKIGILTLFYRNFNYGGTLQAYALYKALLELGVQTDLITYDNGMNPNPIYHTFKEQIKQYNLLVGFDKFKKRILSKFTFLIRNIISIREKKFLQFTEENIKSTELYYDNNLHTLPQQYIGLISGSDQVWNPNSVRKLYLQEYVQSNCRKISYAASISRDRLSNKEASVLIPAIKRFDYIGVREKTAQKILENYNIRDTVVTVDPTFLLSDLQWNYVASPRVFNGKYALCYFFSKSVGYRRSVQKFCKEKNIELVFIPYVEQKFNIYDIYGLGRKINEVGPAEFLSLIRDAEYVFTDSFHGIVFSIIYKKEFIVFKRDKNGQTSKNSRLTDLMTDFMIQNRILSSSRGLVTVLESKIDYQKVSRILEDKIETSLNFLKRATNIK